MIKKLAIVILVLVLITEGFLLYSKNNSSISNKIHSVVLTKDGFSPSEITIRQGDAITFTTTAEKEFWPASDLHPTHGIYPEFDPKQPINPKDSWSFKFDKVGTWRFHDHLNSLHVGTIIVTGNPQTRSDKCSDLGDKIKCWQDMLNKTLEQGGLPATFDLLAELYAKEPLFASECHSFTHEIGKYTYSKFKSGEDFDLNSKTSYCGYGFYHGFMETLLHATGDIKQAQDFCKYVGVKLANETTDGEGACYHGIGHGAVDGGDPSSWGDAKKMIAPSLNMCEKVAGDDHSQYGKLYRCVTGAYNAIEILSADPKYKLSQIQEDPFYICPSQIDEYKEACYTNMLPALLRFTNNDLLKGEKYIEKIPPNINFPNMRENVVSDLFHEFIRMNLNLPEYNIASGIAICHSLSNLYRKGCINGLAGGHMKYGNPGEAYVKGLTFCARIELRDDEKDVCYNSILSRLLIWYSPSKSKDICKTVPGKFQKYCR